VGAGTAEDREAQRELLALLVRRLVLHKGESHRPKPVSITFRTLTGLAVHHGPVQSLTTDI
jgi:hypothetical protein